MSLSVVLIPEGTTPYDVDLPWQRTIAELEGANPYQALRIVQESGILVESYWVLDCLWIAGYDRAEALQEALDAAGASAVQAEIVWGRCLLRFEDRVWQGDLDVALEAALGLERGVGAEALFRELPDRTQNPSRR